jgi:hypothetical protein
MSESFLERMSRFTPDAGGLDRDALLFAAGRGAARSNRVWKTLAAVLAGTQAMTLALLWSSSLASRPGVTVQMAATEKAIGEAVTTESTANPGVWSAGRSLDMFEDRSDESVTLVDSEPALRVNSSLTESALN